MMTNKIDALNMLIDELKTVTEILEDLRNDPSKDPVAICRERGIEFGRFLHYTGDLVKGEITRIEDLGLGRSYRVLKRAGINTISDLAQLTVSDILRIRNMGYLSAAEIVDKLDEIGISIPEGNMTQLERLKWRDARDYRRKVKIISPLKIKW